MSEPTEMLDTEQAAAYLGGIPPETLRLWRYRGTGPPYIRVVKAIRYRRADLDRWIEQSRIEPRASTS